MLELEGSLWAIQAATLKVTIGGGRPRDQQKAMREVGTATSLIRERVVSQGLVDTGPST